MEVSAFFPPGDNPETSVISYLTARSSSELVAAARLGALADIPLLKITVEASRLASAIVRAHLLPGRAFPDALHIALGAVHDVDYLLT